MTRYEYERLIAVNHIADDLTKREKELAERERNFASQVQEAIYKRFPEELQMTREDRAYCDEWIPKAREVEKKEKELLEREESLLWRERKLDVEVQNHAQDLFRELRENFFEKMREKISNVRNSVFGVLEKLLPMMMFVDIKEAINKIFNKFERQLELHNEEFEIEVDEVELDD